MSQRGPDSEGLWSNDGVVLGHRRLAILDLDARAHEPMVSSDGRYTIVFNGEIYTCLSFATYRIANDRLQ